MNLLLKLCCCELLKGPEFVVLNIPCVGVYEDEGELVCEPTFVSWNIGFVNLLPSSYWKGKKEKKNN